MSAEKIYIMVLESLLSNKELFLSIILKVIMVAELAINTTPSKDLKIYFYVYSSPQPVAGLGQMNSHSTPTLFL